MRLRRGLAYCGRALILSAPILLALSTPKRLKDDPKGHPQRVESLASLVAPTIRQEVGLRQPAFKKPVEASGPSRANTEQLNTGLGKLPLYFIENQGQVDSRVAYYLQGSETAVYFTSQGVTFGLTERNEQEARRRWAVKLDFVGANPGAKPLGQDRTPAAVSYFKGDRAEWRTGVPTYGGVLYRDLWPGIDLVYGGTGSRLKYTFLVQPRADPNQIRLAYRGATAVRLTEEGRLDVSTPVGGFEDEKPYAYQEVGSARVEVAAAYSLEANDGETYRYGFQLGDYDESKPLILDPVILAYCGYIGGSGSDSGLGVAVDSSRNVYVAGYTTSTEASFPETAGPDLTFNGSSDVFVAKLNASGTALVYCGYLGGSADEYGYGVAVDGSGNAYVTGYTNSTEATFPVTVGPDLTFNGLPNDAFIAKVNAAGTALSYCGYIGGSGSDEGRNVAVDGSGNAYVAGESSSTEVSFPVMAGPDLTYNGGGADAFVAKVNSAGTALTYCGYIGGSADDRGRGVTLNGSGNAFVTGLTLSDEATFPATAGSLDPTYNGGSDAFIAEVSLDGLALAYCGYIGGSGNDEGRGVAVDGSGSAYVTGYTGSTQASFPVFVGPDLTFNGVFDAFVAKVNSAGTALVYCGYIGGAMNDQGWAIAVDGSGSAYVTGYTGSSEASFPVAVGPDLTFNGLIDTFVAKVDAGGASLAYCGYIGGSGNDYPGLGGSIALDGSGNAYVAGETGSSETSFPVTVGPDLTLNGGQDAFVAKVSTVSGGGTCIDLVTAEGPGSFTVTAPASFEMTYAKAAGGGIRSFYDLAEDPARTYDLAAGVSDVEALFSDELLIGGNWYTTGANNVDSKLDLLEATATRVRLRQEAFFQQEGVAAILGVAKGFGDHSVYPSGKVALRWNRKTTSSLPFTQTELTLNAHWQPAGPLNGWAGYSETGGAPFPHLGGGDDFLLYQNEVPGVRTDFLQILYQDWALADMTDSFTDGAREYADLSWTDNTAGTLAAGSNETWNFLSYVKPTNFVDHLDPAVTTRRADYRSPDTLAVIIGSPWNDPAENTAADDFNESEGAYVQTFDPSLGLRFDIDGAAVSRYHPFFKIRQWRSLQDPLSVTLEGVPIGNNVDYRADVKPVARAHFAQDLLWHSTLENAGAVNAFPDVGSPGTVSAGAFVPARYGSGFRVTANGDYVTFSTVDFDKARGALEFWFQPDYGSGDAAAHYLAGFRTNPNNEWILGKAASNSLFFFIVAGGATSTLEVTPANYGWVASEWVHLRMEWDDSAPLATQQRLYINGVEPPHIDPTVDYNAAGLALPLDFNIGRQRTGQFSTGLYDEVHSYGLGSTASTPTPLAYGGLTSNANEYLADAGRNFTLDLTAFDVTRRGEYLYFGADSKFRGLNVALATPGAGDALLEWFYWNGTAWVSLPAAVAGFTDETAHLTRNGTVYWPGDPFNWSPYSVNGGPDLYYVRAHVATGSYTTLPVEKAIKTDILLFQYCGDITLDAQTFDFGMPAPTAVELLSFEARGGDRAVEVSWETAAEVENLGFYLYRGSSQQGPFGRITATLIPGLGSSPLGARYRYLDSSLMNGQTYFYFLEDVETSGVRTRHGPVSATPQPGALSPTPPSAPTAGIVYGEPDQTSLRVVSSDRSGMTLELRTGGFTAEPQEDGTVRLSIPGFAEERGAIPVKRVWLEAVVGRKVRIASVEAADLATFSSLRPSGAEIPEVVATRGVVRAGSRRANTARSPEEWARLVSVGFQEEVKKALLELSPLRWNGTELSLARRLTVRVSFAGREADEHSTRGARGRKHREPSSHARERVMARLLVKQRGLYAVRLEDVLVRGVAADKLRLSHQGKPVAYHLEGASRQFGPGSVLYFVSEGAALNPYGDAAVYELTVGEDAVRMPRVEGRPSGTPTPWYWKRLEREENRIYQPALLEAEEPWFWDTLLSPVTKNYPFSVNALASPAGTAQLTLWLQGASDFVGSPDHHVRVLVNGSLVAEGSWDGKKPQKLEAEIPPGVLREGENQISIENVGDTEADSSMVMLERFALLYPRLTVAEAGVLEGGFSESGVAEVSGLAGRALVVDVTEEPPRWLTGVEPARFAAQAGRKYLAVGAEAVLKAEVARPLPSGLRSERNLAEYLVVGPAKLLLEAAPLLELRRSQGLRSRAVPIEEVYSEFGFGEQRPEALRDFLAYAYHHWRKPSPRYVLLVGDATYDFKDYLKTGVKNQVPPFLVKTSYWLTAADPTYASVNGEDALPDLAIGRLPASTVEEARSLVAKIVAYETGRASLEGRAVLVVDNPDRGGNFEADAEDIATSLLAGRPVETILVSELGRDGTRAAILDAFDRGPSLMSYLGHGAILVWASENVLNNLDVKSLSAQQQQPFLLTMNCLNGYFHFPYLNSLAEELVKAEGRGAVGAFSPSGLSLNGPAHRYHKALLSEILSGKRERLGDALLAAQAAFADGGEFLELLSIYHLLGDPALKLH